MPSAFEVLRLITVSNIIGCSTGRSAGLVAFENPASVRPYLPICASKARSVAHQATSRRKLSDMVDRWNRVAGCERHELIALRVEERVVLNDQRPNPLPS
jgi:hypothetical protein